MGRVFRMGWLGYANNQLEVNATEPFTVELIVQPDAESGRWLKPVFCGPFINLKKVKKT